MTTTTVTIASEGITVSKLIWRLLKRQPEGFAEIVLDANPGISKYGPVIPVGTIVTIPLDAIPSAPAARPVIRLWG